MLAILLISAKYKRVFSAIKHLITNSRNRLKANIVKANECLKSQYGRLKPKAFQRGVNPNINDLYKEEAAAKAAAKATTKKDSNIIGNADKEKDKEEDKEKDKEQDKQEGELGESNYNNNDDKSNKGDAIKYIVIDD